MKIFSRLLAVSLKFRFDFVNVTNKRNFRAFSIPKFSSYHSITLFNLIKPSNLLANRRYMDLASVIKVFEEQVPPTLAEKWDNTGLLVEPSNKCSISTIFFTNDLTEPVLNEAVAKKSDIIISYHPPIFSSMKSLKQLNWKDRIVIKCIENSIAVYSPHTCCDAVDGGVNDWLISCFNLSICNPIVQSYECQSIHSHIITIDAHLDADMQNNLKSMSDCEVTQASSSPSPVFTVKVNKSSLIAATKFLTEKVPRSSIHVTQTSTMPLSSCGMGRVGTLVTPLTLGECIKVVKSHLNLDSIRFSQGIAHLLDTPVSTIAVCAGSGSSILKGVKADLYITGEMSHHDILDACHQNVSVILCEHSNSERGYLQQLVKKLSPKLTGIKLIISSTDKDPISIV